jgi:3-oxoacyl-[acyl-carrier protein] reductase
MAERPGRGRGADGPLAGRVALVTGGGRGIGRGIALELAAAGADVAVNYRRDAEAAAVTVAEVRALGVRSIALAASMSEPAEIDELCGRLEAFGVVDLLVANAGQASRGNVVADSELDEFARLMQTHSFSAVQLAQRLLPGMRAEGGGDVVLISSSEVASMRAGGAPYNMAKSALEALAMTLAHEEAENRIRVNVVAPGLVVTDMGRRLVKAKAGLDDITELDAAQPFGRVCRPADIGRVVRSLCGSDLELVTGQRLTVDGGSDASPTGG